MKTCIGSPARGEKFFYRKKLIDKAWDKIENGSNILIVAPRRVGKTSIMFHLLDNPRDDYKVIYVDMESANSESEFFRRLLNKILKSGILNKLLTAITFLEKHRPEIKKIGADGIEFGVRSDLDYLDLLVKVIKSINESKSKLILMIDEYPQTLENIIKDKGVGAGTKFLQSNRELRMDPDLNQTITYIYAGSIGLENIVSKINSIGSINDLAALVMPPLQNGEEFEFIHYLLQDVSFNLHEEQIKYIFNKIEWLIPFHIQLVIQGINDLIIDGEIEEISNQIIDSVFKEMIKQRNHFDHWHTRLRTSFDSDEYTFAKEILNIISESETINSSEIFEIVVKQKLEKNYKDIIGSLIYDGYINNNDDPKIYRYNSPIVRMWWRKYVAN